jgi:rhamnose utilization protein RhaD (predicted bifunctional aldolase and dehydrogenase)
MENLFNEKESFEFAAKYPDAPRELSLRVYTTRLLGGNSRLVLHGGGNTSVKLKIPGEESDVIFVKGTGWDMASIEPEGFTGLYLQPLRKLRGFDDLSASEMEDQVKACRISADSPAPSVEALLHAFILHRYVEHTHSDSILIITNQKHGESMIKEAMGEKIAVLPYIASGFPLAKAAAEAFDRQPDIDGIVIMNHGIFTFAEDVRASYNKMIAYVNRAEAYIEQQIKGKTLLTRGRDLQIPANADAALARCVRMIRDACAGCGTDEKQEQLFTEIRNAPDIIEISISEPAREICRSGMLTPHHAILAKHAMAYIASVPEDDESLRAVINREIANFKSDYDRLFYESSEGEGESSPAGRGASGLHSHAERGNEEGGKLFYESSPAGRGASGRHSHAERGNERADVYPSLFFIAGLGLVAVGESRKAACIAADIGEHNIRAKIRAFALGEYQAVSDSHVFDIYRSLSKKSKAP